MKVSYVEGLATHNGPESCVGVREDEGKALTGVRTFTRACFIGAGDYFTRKSWAGL
jgi:hypothetical protein